MKENEIKALTPTTCPHCKEQIIVEFVAPAPIFSGIYTVEEMEKAKEEVIRKVRDLKSSNEFTESIIKWIQSPDIIFGPNDIEQIIKNIEEKEYESKKETQKTTS